MAERRRTDHQVDVICCHDQAETRRSLLEKLALRLQPRWPQPNSVHINPIRLDPSIPRNAHRDSGEEAVPDLELVNGHVGVPPPFADDRLLAKLSFGSPFTDPALRRAHALKNPLTRREQQFVNLLAHVEATERYCISIQ